MAIELTKEQLLWFQGHPVEWIEDFLETELWWKQKEIVTAVANEPRVTVRSGHGMGKSYSISGTALWFLFTHPYSKVIITSPSHTHTLDVIFEEIRKFHEILKGKMTYAGDMTTARLKLAPNWWIVARNVDNPHAFIGRHAQNMLVIFDEASGIPRELFDAAKGLLTSVGNKVILIGNPIPPATFFHETHTGEQPGYYRIKISCFDSPNIYFDEKVQQWRDFDPLPFPQITSMAFINDMRDTYGERSPFWVSKVLGEFPTSGEDMLLDSRWLSASIQKGIYLREVIERLQEGKEMLSSSQIAQIVGR